jgi:hypothetical protein
MISIHVLVPLDLRSWTSLVTSQISDTKLLAARLSSVGCHTGAGYGIEHFTGYSLLHSHWLLQTDPQIVITTSRDQDNYSIAGLKPLYRYYVCYRHLICYRRLPRYPFVVYTAQPHIGRLLSAA